MSYLHTSQGLQTDFNRSDIEGEMDNIIIQATQTRGMRSGIAICGGNLSKNCKTVSGITIRSNIASADDLLTGITIQRSTKHAGYELQQNNWRFFYLKLLLTVGEFHAVEKMLRELRPKNFI